MPAPEPATIVVAGEGLLSRRNLLTLGAVLALMAAYRLAMLAALVAALIDPRHSAG